MLLFALLSICLGFASIESIQEWDTEYLDELEKNGDFIGHRDEQNTDDTFRANITHNEINSTYACVPDCEEPCSNETLVIKNKSLLGSRMASILGQADNISIHNKINELGEGVDIFWAGGTSPGTKPTKFFQKSHGGGNDPVMLP